MEARNTNRRARRFASVPPSAVAILIAAATIVAAATLFTHTFPATPAGATPVLTSTCVGGTLVMQTAVLPLTGTAGALRFDCGPLGTSGVTALTVAVSGSVTPSFALPAGATGVSLVTHVTTNAQCSGGTALTSGALTPLTAPASLDYCLSFASYPSGGIPTWSMTWSE